MPENIDMVTMWAAIGHISATAHEMETNMLNK